MYDRRIRSDENEKMSTTLPDSLTHYTTLQGFMGIIEAKGFWASNASFLNDRSELVHGLNGAEQAISELEDVIGDEFHQHLPTVINEIKTGALPATYVTCFCEHEDLLSQWRGYGGSEQGISIQFRRAALEKGLAKSQAKLAKVIYSDLSTKKKVRSALAGELKDLLEWENTLGGQTVEERKAGVFDVVSQLLPRFKHYGFRDEREWRFVVQRSGDDDALQFRAKGTVIAPYIVMTVPGARLPIKSITVGPGREMDLTAASIRLYLKQRGYTVPVNLSRVPFRS
jgi:hypothetical protein